LRQQRDSFLPLKVIKGRLEGSGSQLSLDGFGEGNGEIDLSGEGAVLGLGPNGEGAAVTGGQAAGAGGAPEEPRVRAESDEGPSPGADRGRRARVGGTEDPVPPPPAGRVPSP